MQTSVAATVSAIPNLLPTVVIPTGSPLLSDNFNRGDTERCALGPAQVSGGGSSFTYLPIFPTNNDASNPVGANIRGAELVNNGLDFGGVQVATSPGACSNVAVRGTNLGQDLAIRMRVLVPRSADGLITSAGPYFRSRAAARGDGIAGGSSSGYWVQLHSNGEVQVKRLNPFETIAVSRAPTGFDPFVYHTLLVAVRGSSLTVTVDNRAVRFEQQGDRSGPFELPPLTTGSNDGTVGVAFGAEQNRGRAGGQRIDDLVIERLP
jgi:hypothetical protein